MKPVFTNEMYLHVLHQIIIDKAWEFNTDVNVMIPIDYVTLLEFRELPFYFFNNDIHEPLTWGTFL